MICPRCTTTSEKPGARFCLQCGTALVEDGFVQPPKGIADSPPPEREEPPGGASFTVVNLDDVKLHSLQVVGESFYQDDLEDIAGGKDYQSANISTRALLVPEVDNPYDSNAVCVLIDNRTVGYVPREIAARLQPVLVDMFRRRRFVLSCPAKIVGGWYRGEGDEGSFGVQLKVPSIEDIVEAIGLTPVKA